MHGRKRAYSEELGQDFGGKGVDGNFGNLNSGMIGF